MFCTLMCYLCLPSLDCLHFSRIACTRRALLQLWFRIKYEKSVREDKNLINELGPHFVLSCHNEAIYSGICFDAQEISF